MTTLIRTWHFARNNRLVIGNVGVESLAEARCYAARWNRDASPEQRIEVISTSPIPAQGWVTAVA